MPALFRLNASGTELAERRVCNGDRSEEDKFGFADDSAANPGLFACTLTCLLSVAAFAQQAADPSIKRGSARQRTSSSTGAVIGSDQAPELRPEGAFSYYYLGLTKAYEGNVNGAIADFNRLIRLNPKDAIAYYNRGLLEATKGDLDGGIADFDRAIQLGPNFARAYNDQGSVKAIKGDLDRAIADFNHLIELNPKDALAFENRAFAKQLKGDFEGALGDLVLSDELTPQGESLDYLHLYYRTAESDRTES